MRSEMEGTDQPAPEYRQNGVMVYATIRQAKNAVTTEKTTEKTTEQTTEKILSLILENPNITTEELARVCDMTPWCQGTVRARGQVRGTQRKLSILTYCA